MDAKKFIAALLSIGPVTKSNFTIKSFSVTCLLIVGLLCSTRLRAQESKKEPSKFHLNSIGIYLGALDFNLNYERNILQHRASYSNIRLGGGYFSSLGAQGAYLNPAFVHIFGKSSSHAEFNIGLKFFVTGSRQSVTSSEAPFVLFDLFGGYRYEPPAGRFFFRAGISVPSLINVGTGLRF